MREDGGTLVYRWAERGDDGCYDMVNLFGEAVAGGDADDVAFKEGRVGVRDEVSPGRGEVLCRL